MEEINDALKSIGKIIEILKQYDEEDFPELIEISNLAKNAVDKLASCSM
jgi:hypothetical protein